MSLIPVNKTFGITDAIVSLCPNSQWILTGDNYSGIEWLSDETDHPSEEAVLAEVERLQAEYDALEYQRLRVREYPDVAEYMDGLVKGDQDQMDAYVAACLAVKAKYPKP